jgi:hypothetical protein
MMSRLPVDLALTLARGGLDLGLAEDDLCHALHTAIGERRGYIDGLTLGETGWTVTLLFPEKTTFDGRTAELALAWCLVYLMGETGELGIGGFAS